MELPINIEKFKHFDFYTKDYDSFMEEKNVYIETFWLENEDSIQHMMEFVIDTGFLFEGITIEWKGNPFDLDYTKDNYLRKIK